VAELALIAAEIGVAVFGVGVGWLAAVIAYDIMREWRTERLPERPKSSAPTLSR
jgi:hypothetical protein